MGRIKDTGKYQKDTNITDNDIVIGSDVENSYLTKNYRIRDIKDYILSGITSSAFPFKIYSSRITQAGTAAPSVYSEDYNTLTSLIAFSRTGVGVYLVTISGTEDFSKCFYTITNNRLDKADDTYIVIRKTSTNVLTINTFKSNLLSDGVLSETPLKIEIYPVV